MSTEYGVFNDEGCLEVGFWTIEAAETHAATLRANWDHAAWAPAANLASDERTAADPNAYAAELCPDHEEQPLGSCEGCFEDQDDEPA